VKRTTKTPKRDAKKSQSLKRDAFAALGPLLRATREQKGLTQKALADRLGLRQRQISDLERSAMDPRFSTVQDVARALELELVLVPRQLVPVVEDLQSAERSASRPMYALDDEGEGEDEDKG
jgi:HTH-type transcriptional regulator / antitoxin HipB